MNRYKQATRNEFELREISGVKPILRPTRDEYFETILIFRDGTSKKSFDLVRIRKYLTQLLYNSMCLWVDNKRTNQREEGTENITMDDIDAYVVANIFELWGEVLIAFKIVDEEKVKEAVAEELSKQKKGGESDPN